MNGQKVNVKFVVKLVIIHPKTMTEHVLYVGIIVTQRQACLKISQNN